MLLLTDSLFLRLIKKHFYFQILGRDCLKTAKNITFKAILFMFLIKKLIMKATVLFILDFENSRSTLSWDFLQIYTRATLELLIPPPPLPNKMKELFIHLRINYFKVSTVEVKFFFRPFEPRLKERKKLNFWKKTQGRPYPSVNFSLSQNAIPCVLSLNFEKRKE